jgi:(4S)-4-hydroxy-5-phosphonooxypentane-2,3-dione isomerase
LKNICESQVKAASNLAGAKAVPWGAEAKPVIVIHVHVKVKPESIEAFKQATLENALNSIQEPGIARFDFVQQQDDESRFVLVEAYRSKEAQAAHRDTAHYLKWRDTVEPMMAEPRQRALYSALFPDEKAW